MLDRPHLGQVEREQAALGEGEQFIRGQVGQGYGLHAVGGGGILVEVNGDGAKAEVLDGRVAEQAAGKAAQVVLGEIAGKLVAGTGGDLAGGQADLDHTAGEFTGGHVGHARAISNFDYGRR